VTCSVEASAQCCCKTRDIDPSCPAHGNWVEFVKRDMQSDNMRDLARAERKWPESIR